MRQAVALACLALACCAQDRTGNAAPISGSDWTAREEALQSQVEELLAETGVPGIVVAMAKGSDTPISAAAGYADIHRGIPLRADTQFFIGSISKNVFAVITLQLAEEGRLHLDDPLSKFLEWPRGDEITVRMLMNHTSGIPDYFSALSLSGSQAGAQEFFSNPRPPPAIMAMMPSRDPTFDPGSSQRYSNTNGLIVGEVIEQVTGKGLGAVLEERIVSRLGLTSTYLYEGNAEERPRARGYCGMPGWVSVPGELSDCSFADESLVSSADGSIVSSAVDLLRYHQALRGGELLSESSWEAMRRVEPGIDNGLGYLIMSGPSGDHEGNAGRSMGHLSANVYYLERDLFVVMMLNRGDARLPMRRFLEMRPD